MSAIPGIGSESLLKVVKIAKPFAKATLYTILAVVAVVLISFDIKRSHGMTWAFWSNFCSMFLWFSICSNMELRTPEGSEQREVWEFCRKSALFFSLFVLAYNVLVLVLDFLMFGLAVMAGIAMLYALYAQKSCADMKNRR